jgi:hypothetical protein
VLWLLKLATTAAASRRTLSNNSMTQPFSDIGASDWFNITPVTVVGRRKTYVELPAFEIENPAWVGASQIVAQYNFSAAQNFYILKLPTKPEGCNFGLCVRYRVGETVTRYKLWDDDKFILSDDVDVAPELLTETNVIKKNFVLEIWSFQDEETSSLETAIRIKTSPKIVPTDMRVRTDVALAQGTMFSDLFSTNDNAAILTGRMFWFDINEPNFEYTNPISLWLDRDTGLEADSLAIAVGQPTTAPALVTASAEINGLDYVSFDGVNDLLYGSKVYQFPLTVYLYIKPLNLSSLEIFLSLMYGVDSGVIWTVEAGKMGGMYDGRTVNIDATVGEWMLVTMQLAENAKLKLRINNTAIVESDIAPVLYTIDSIAVGGGPVGPANWAECGIAEIVGYNAIHTEAQMNLMHEYFIAKYQNAMAVPLEFDENGPWLDNA